MVHKGVLRALRGKRFEVPQSRLEQDPGALFFDARKKDETGMDGGPGAELPEVPGVLGNDDPVLFDAAGEYDVVLLPAAPGVQWMDRIMPPGVVQTGGQIRREALVDKEPHFRLSHGRPPGRPTRGFARA